MKAFSVIIFLSILMLGFSLPISAQGGGGGFSFTTRGAETPPGNGSDSTQGDMSLSNSFLSRVNAEDIQQGAVLLVFPSGPQASCEKNISCHVTPDCDLEDGICYCYCPPPPPGTSSDGHPASTLLLPHF